MRVAIDARLLTGTYTGDRTYWRGLLKAFGELLNPDEHRLILFSTRPIPEGTLPQLPVYERAVAPTRNERLWSLIRLPQLAMRHKCDLVHTQYTVSPFFRIPAITTVHDISFLIEPRWFRLKDRVLLRLSVPVSCRRAKFVLTVSETSREDIIQLLHLPPEKVIATPNGVPEGFHPLDKHEAHAWARKQYGIEPPFALAVGVLQPRKNWELALLAVHVAREEYKLPVRLVLTGKPGWAQRPLEQLKRELDAREWLIETGYVPDEHLVWLYNAADVVLYPSFYEGFGLPPLEAMACGTPVVASNSGALPEVVGSGGILLPPDEPGLWANAIRTVLENESFREALRQRALQQARRFSWRTTAERTLEAYQKALSAG
ncbi:MAG: glycosyltransferase family 4 protein [Fimbriimonadales bacterium]|nr:glycosyltransferase family 4 protein [Fimbriimonadales bacterium]MDW8051702.1 glycosyltransferase family 1 protein [Armatimonadota bacterium]